MLYNWYHKRQRDAVEVSHVMFEGWEEVEKEVEEEVEEEVDIISKIWIAPKSN